MADDRRPDPLPAGTLPALPTGTVTFLLTDVEGSTAGWESDRAAMAAAIVRHYEILDAAVSANGGVRPVEQGEGDSVVAAFPLASQAVRAAVAIQLALATEPWTDGARPLVRVALHTGESQLRDAGNYMGPAVIRTARLRAIGHGGQILCSGPTADLTADDLPDGVALADLGAHRLKDLGRPEHVFQVTHPQLRLEFPALRSLDAVPNNLPVHLTSFIGREAELTEIAELAAKHRLVTLTGSGGTGKTRLAARIAAELAPSRRDGAWWVELAPLTDPDLVTEALLGALQVADAPGRTALQRLTVHLATRDLVIVLDNCEHLLDACAELADTLLRSCPTVSVLATSREALGVGGELTWKVPPLGLPDRDSAPPPESLSNFEAIRLFVDRAVKARPNFTVTNTSAPVIAEICARLDGIPLAIELAAARVRVLTPQQILTGLQDRFKLLTGGTRGAMPRQQTLEASVAWSHDLLSADERVLFRRLAVFAGGFSLDAAESVGAGVDGGAADGLEPAAALDLLDGLVAKSLVVVVDDLDGTTSRYRLLETVRDFAALCLSRAEETAAARDAHLRWCLAAGQRAEAELVGITPDVIRRLSPDQDNYRTALDWAIAAGDAESALVLARCHAFLLINRGRSREAREALTRALALPDAPPVPRAETLWMLGLGQWYVGDMHAVQATVEEVFVLARAAGDRRMEGRAYELSGCLLLFFDPPAARAALAAAQPLVEEAGDAWALMDIAIDQLMIAARSDDAEGAALWAERAQTLADAHGSHWFACWALLGSLVIALTTGDMTRSRACAERAVALATGLGDVAVSGLAHASLAQVELLEGRPERALVLTEPAIGECADAAAYIALPYVMTVRARAVQALDRPDARAALEEALGVARQVEDPWQRAPIALEMARFLLAAGETGGVEALIEEARTCGLVVESPWVDAAADHVSGLLAAARDQPDQAEKLHHGALAARVRNGYALAVVDSLEALAAVAAGQESWAEAARLVGSTTRRREELGYRHGRSLAAAAEADARAGLGDEAYESYATEGRELPIEAAVAYASRARGERKRPSSGWGSLTPMELEVARLAAEGLSNSQIAQRLFIAVGTTKIHLSHIYAKLGVANRTQLGTELTRREA